MEGKLELIEKYVNKLTSTTITFIKKRKSFRVARCYCNLFLAIKRGFWFSPITYTQVRRVRHKQGA
jgi:hypothetical protein